MSNSASGGAQAGGLPDPQQRAGSNLPGGRSLQRTRQLVQLLHSAVLLGDTVLVEHLLAQGVDPNSKDVYEQTPLHVAVLHGHFAVAKLLLAHGAIPNTAEGAGFTPLHDAAEAGRLDLVRLLLNHGADPNANVNIVGATPLHDAARTGHRTVTALLLARGASTTIRDKEGHTPLDVAIAHSRKKIAALLIKRSVDELAPVGRPQEKREIAQASVTVLQPGVLAGEAEAAEVNAFFQKARLLAAADRSVTR